MLSLSEEGRRAALQLARAAVVEAVSNRKLLGSIPREGIFAERCGVFVTLHVRGRLQGCIGVVEANEPLGEAVAIEIGRHGLLMVLHACRGLLLPQVAIEHQLTREQFLEETCCKAGLRREAWRDPEARIFGFTCEVFSESSHPERT